MNEQIKRLATEARLLTGWSVGEVEYQKFAKLIIEECVDYALANGDNVDYLKQYFGVE